MASSSKLPDTAVRIRQLRKAEGFPSKSAFAAKLGITLSRLSNIENTKPLSIDVAKRIVQKVHGVSLDWLYLGKEEAMSKAVLERLSKVPPESATMEQGSRR